MGSSPIFRPIRKSPRFRAGFFFFCRQVTGLEKGPALTPTAVAGSPGTDEPCSFPVRREGQAWPAPFWGEEGRSCPWPTAARCDRRPWGLPLQDGDPSRMEATALAASGRAALAKAGPFAYKTSHHGAWRSMVAHLLWEQGVAGSNPVAPTIKDQEVIPRCGVTSFCFCGQWRPCRRESPQALGKARPIFPCGRFLRACLGRRGRGRAARSPICKDRQGGAWAVRTGRLIPSSGPAALPGRPSPHRTARAGGNGFSGRRVSCARR